MSLVSTAELLTALGSDRSAVLAFNVVTLEHAQAIAAGAERAGRGAILQISENAIRFHGGDPRPILAAAREVATASSAPLSLHLDHVEDPALIDLAVAHAAEWGLGSIMVDGSRLEDEANIAFTADAAARAHESSLWVEAELGEIGGKKGAHAVGARTDPAEAEMFVAATGVDALAVAVGSVHAMRDRSARVDTELVARIAARVPVPLVLHGSSGIDDDGIRDAILAGIRKVNVGTALNIAGTAAVRAVLAADRGAADPRPSLAAARAAMTDVVAAFCALGSGGVTASQAE